MSSKRIKIPLNHGHFPASAKPVLTPLQWTGVSGSSPVAMSRLLQCWISAMDPEGSEKWEWKQGDPELRTNILIIHFHFLFWDRFSLCSSAWPESQYVDQTDFEFRNLPASASQMLGLKACITTHRHLHFLLKKGWRKWKLYVGG